MTSALSVFREDQRRSGLSVREYERLHGIFLSDIGGDRPQGRVGEIRRTELPLSETAETLGARPHCPACGRSIRNRRDRIERP